MALSKLKKIEQMVIIEEPNKYDLKTFHANFNIEVESGKMVLTAKNLEIGYDKPIQNVTFELYKGQKLGIIGENGIGKSTLLKTLNGNIQKFGGEFEYGYHVVKGYFDQQMEFLNTENTVFDEISNTFPNLTTTQIRNILGSFLFSGDDAFKKIKVLSGGEKGRLQLCKILKQGPNLLLLDEPTNHMDIVGKESLENILKEYKGTLIFVSHDRYFVNKIADSLLIFEKNKVTYFNGNYEEYTRKRIEQEEKINDQINKKETINSRNSGQKENSYFLNKEKSKTKNKISKIEREIEQIESEKKQIEEQMQDEEICTDYLKLKELQENLQKLNEEIENKMEEWESLNCELVELEN